MDHYSLMLEAEAYAQYWQQVAFEFRKLFEIHKETYMHNVWKKAVNTSSKAFARAGWHRAALKAGRS